MPFQSVLFERPPATPAPVAQEPEFFADLNLDQVVAAVCAGHQELKAFFYAPLHQPDQVEYRQEVVRDLAPRGAREAVKAFALGMQTARQYLTEAGLTEKEERLARERLFLDGADAYCTAVASLHQALDDTELASRGLGALRQYLAEYTAGSGFAFLIADVRRQRQALAEVRYNLLIDAGHVTVSRYGGEADYSTEVEKTFAKFQRSAARDYRVTFPERQGINLVEAHIIELVARLYPGVFSGVHDFYLHHQGFLDQTLERFDREVKAYVAYLDFIEPLAEAGLSFCYPQISASSREAGARDSFDLALAWRLHSQSASVVVNSFRLNGPERVIVVTGPNQGGKTTFARMFGQLHHLAALGLPVPGSEAHLLLPDKVFTHFETPEDVENSRGKLEDELLRAHHMLRQATPRTVIIVNEGFASTTLSDTLLLGTEILQRMLRLDVLCVYVTFVDELASLSEATVSMVATVDERDPSRRTYRIVRQPASGLAYAAALANKYGLGYQRLKERLAP